MAKSTKKVAEIVGVILKSEENSPIAYYQGDHTLKSGDEVCFKAINGIVYKGKIKGLKDSEEGVRFSFDGPIVPTNTR